MRSANELLDHVIAEFGADPERVFVTGVSSGGNGAWLAASNYPDRFAAFVPLCGDGGGDPRRIGYAGIPVWIFNNELDNVNVVEYNRTMRKRLIELGHSPIVTEYHELGHDCWNRAYHSTAMYSWLLQQSRSRNQREKKFNYAPADKLVAEWRRIGDDGWTVGEDATLVFSGERSGVSRSVGAESPMPPGAVEDDSAPSNDRAKSGNNAIANALQGASDSNPVPFLVSPFQSRDLEIHVDVWLTAGADERIGLVQDDTAAGFFVSVVSPDAGTGGVVTEDGRWLARLDAAAQRMLRTDAWNDVRLKLAEGRLTVVLNGWPAVDIAIGDVDSERGKFRVAIAAPRNRLAGKWRYVRTRVL